MHVDHGKYRRLVGAVVVVDITKERSVRVEPNNPPCLNPVHQVLQGAGLYLGSPERRPDPAYVSPTSDIEAFG